MRIRPKKKTILDQASEFAESVISQIEPAVETAKEIAAEAAAEAFDRAVEARDKAAPLIADARGRAVEVASEARGKAAPLIADAREKAAPLIADARVRAAEARERAAAGAAEGKAKAVAKVAELKGEEPAPRRRKWPILAGIAGLLGIGVVVWKRFAAGDDDNWETSYVPSPATTPAAVAVDQTDELSAEDTIDTPLDSDETDAELADDIDAAALSAEEDVIAVEAGVPEETAPPASDLASAEGAAVDAPAEGSEPEGGLVAEALDELRAAEVAKESGTDSKA